VYCRRLASGQVDGPGASAGKLVLCLAGGVKHVAASGRAGEEERAPLMGLPGSLPAAVAEATLLWRRWLGGRRNRRLCAQPKPPTAPLSSAHRLCERRAIAAPDRVPHSRRAIDGLAKDPIALQLHKECLANVHTPMNVTRRADGLVAPASQPA